jgi:geranylgeranyl diphosphate synthase, type III
MLVISSYGNYLLRISNNNGDRIDDIEDGSILRRGKPAAHAVFGMSQTVNSATYVFAKATLQLEQLSKVDSSRAVFLGE